MKQLFYLLVFSIVLVSCKKEVLVELQEVEEVVFDDLDKTIKPGDDFFNHVNKTWYDLAVIEDDQVGVGSYRYLNIPQQKLLQNILEEVSNEEHSSGSIEQLVGDFYASGMDTLSINKRGFQPILPILHKIDAIKNTSDLFTFVIGQIKVGDNSIIYPYISPDQENSKTNIAHFVQTGLGLPDRDYYFKTDSTTVAIQKAYKTYLTTLFELVGEADASNQANVVYKIEEQLAKSHKTRTELRDVKANFRAITHPV